MWVRSVLSQRAFSVRVFRGICRLEECSVAGQQQEQEEREGQEPAGHHDHLANDSPGFKVPVEYEVPKHESGREALGHRSDQAALAPHRIEARPGLRDHQCEIGCAEKADKEFGWWRIGWKPDQLKPAEREKEKGEAQEKERKNDLGSENLTQSGHDRRTKRFARKVQWKEGLPLDGWLPRLRIVT